MDWGQAAKDYGGHILGFLALAQVWAIALGKRLFGKGTLTVYETASIEIGFSNFGPTISLVGTLRAMNKDVFVKTMKVRVIRMQDKAEHTFTWRAFRPITLTLGTGASGTLELAGSFLVATTQPRQYNVFFASAVFAGQYEQYVQPLRDAWRSFVDAEVRQVDEKLAGQIEKILENPTFSAELFKRFLDAGHATALHAALSNGFFWHAGQYELEFTVGTDAPADTTRRWQFALMADEEQLLRLNAITLIRELCNLPVVYSFSYKDYKQA